jgi:hypothetical protein
VETQELKPWQFGYDLAYLKQIASQFDEDHNQYCMSPFTPMKKNNVAQLLHEKQLRLLSNAAFTETFSKVRTPIYMHGNTLIGVKEPGDLSLTHIVGNNEELLEAFQDPTMTRYNTWAFVIADSINKIAVLEEAGFEYVGSKINTFSEIYFVYFRNKDKSSPLQQPRVHPVVPVSEKYNIKRVGNWFSTLLICFNDLKFTNHYSNYNKDNAWAALSLRGYSPDPSFIEKPIEMNKKWQESHKGEEFKMQDTPMMDLPWVREEIGFLTNPFVNNWDELHRIRLMRLKPGGGELQRHTDQVDPELGTTPGSVARLHFPLKTNKDVIFTSWDIYNVPHYVNMQEGQVWYLDIRKPHRAINGGNEDRIHLVVDIEVNQKFLNALNSRY